MSLADSLHRLVINLRYKLCARPSSVEIVRSSLGADKVERPGEARVEESPFFLTLDGKVNLLFVPQDLLTFLSAFLAPL